MSQDHEEFDPRVFAKELIEKREDPDTVFWELMRRGLDLADARQLITELRTLPFLEPLGSGALMPALFLGYEFVGLAGLDIGPHWKKLVGAPALPRWLIHIDVQAGGMAMRYPQALGAMFPLEANRSFALQNPDHLLRGFHAMAEDPDLKVLEQEYPLLRSVCMTRGNCLNPTQLQNIHRSLEATFRLPRPSSGIEAFVRFENSDFPEFLDGWHWTELDLASLDTPTDTMLPEMDYLRWSREFDTFDARMLYEMRAFGAEFLKTDQEPSLFLIWENCD